MESCNTSRPGVGRLFCSHQKQKHLESAKPPIRYEILGILRNPDHFFLYPDNELDHYQN